MDISEMTPPLEKAKQLVEKFKPFIRELPGGEVYVYENAKDCALVAIDEITAQEYPCGMNGKDSLRILKYWNEVKVEIKKMPYNLFKIQNHERSIRKRKKD